MTEDIDNSIAVERVDEVIDSQSPEIVDDVVEDVEVEATEVPVEDEEIVAEEVDAIKAIVPADDRLSRGVNSTRGEVGEASTTDPGDEPLEEINYPRKELPKDDMDMTPMVDVTFLLLIFFMITASFSSEKAFDEPAPRDNAGEPAQPNQNLDTVRVQIDEFNSYTIIFSGGDEREASSKQELLIALGEAREEISTGKNDDELKLLIEAHTECIHAAVVTALDSARDKGFNSFKVQIVEEFQ